MVYDCAIDAQRGSTVEIFKLLWILLLIPMTNPSSRRRGSTLSYLHQALVDYLHVLLGFTKDGSHLQFKLQFNWINQEDDEEETAMLNVWYKVLMSQANLLLLPRGFTDGHNHPKVSEGHFIKLMVTNGDPNYDVKRVKPPTGIPKSMLMATPDGSNSLPRSAVAVLKPNEDAFEKETEGLPSTTRSVGELSPELKWPLCKEVMRDDVLSSKCCFKSFCDKCIIDHIIANSRCVCGDVLADDLLPNKNLRDAINRIFWKLETIALRTPAAWAISQKLEDAKM